MNVYRIILCVCAAAVCVSMVSCASQPPRDVWSLEGWDGNDRFLIRAKGEVTTGVRNIIQRKGHSQADAENNAETALCMLFRVPYKRPKPDDRRLALWTAVHNGKTAAIRYGDEERCEIVYEIEMKDLRRISEEHLSAHD